MNASDIICPAALPPAQTRSELLILADGTILAHNLTPALAAVLQLLNPQDESLKLRSASALSVPERRPGCPQQCSFVSPPPPLCSRSPSPASSVAAPLSPNAYELPS